MKVRGRFRGRAIVLALVDALIAAATFAGLVLFRRAVRLPGTIGPIPVENVPLGAVLLLSIAACALVGLALLETWDDPYPALVERGGILVSSLFASGLVLVVFFVIGQAVPRTILVLWIPVVTLFLTLWRRAAEHLLPIRTRPVLVVGSGPDALEAAAALGGGEIPGHALALHVTDLAALTTGAKDFALPQGEYLDVVFAPQGEADRRLLVDLVETCVEGGIDLWLLSGVLDAVASRPATRRLGDLPLTLVEARGTSLAARALRRTLDLLIAVPLCLVAIPLLALLSAAVSLESHGLPWLRQRRVGLRGRPFDIWKLRTMHAGAEEGTGPVLSHPGDDRVTRLGAFLRRTRLDELPQLFLVLRGTMSLIGPRPERPEFSERYEAEIPAYRLRYLLKPGLTGLAQVMGAYATRTDVKIRYDLGYLFHWTPLLDLFVLVRTLTTVLRASGT